MPVFFSFNNDHFNFDQTEGMYKNQCSSNFHNHILDRLVSVKMEIICVIWRTNVNHYATCSTLDFSHALYAAISFFSFFSFLTSYSSRLATIRWTSPSVVRSFPDGTTSNFPCRFGSSYGSDPSSSLATLAVPWQTKSTYIVRVNKLNEMMLLLLSKVLKDQNHTMT